MTKRERKANQRRNRGARRFFAWCKRISRESMRQAEQERRMMAVDAVLREIEAERAEGGR